MVSRRVQSVTGNPDKTRWVIHLVLSAGTIARLWAATRGHNFDFESWLIAADIFSHGGNIYAETTRYSYGPIWYLILGVFWQAARLLPESAVAFRYIIPGFLTLADIGIFVVLRRKFGLVAAILFFLNPVSIIISGYHLQFDNVAILLGLIAVELWGEECDTALDKRKLASLAILGLSIATKHVLFAFPLWLALKQKRPATIIVVLALPVSLFLLSFLPFWQAGYPTILRNLTEPRLGWNNGVFWNYLPGFGKLILSRETVFISAIAFFAVVFRKKQPLDSLLLYTCVLVIFASIINNQYLAIPTAFISVYPNVFFSLYSLAAALYLFAASMGLGGLLPLIPSSLIGYPAHIALLSSGFIYHLSRPWIGSKLRDGWAGWRSLAAAAAAIAIGLWGVGLIDSEVARQRFVSQAPTTLVSTQVEYDSKIRLLGYNAYESDFKPGGRLQLDLYWQALRPLDKDYTASIQLLDPAGQRLAGADVPLGFDYILPHPTSRWRPGEIVHQTYRLALPETERPTPLRVAVIVYESLDRLLPVTSSAVEVLGDAAAISGSSVLPRPLPLLDPARRLDLKTDSSIVILGTSLPAINQLTHRGDTPLAFSIDWLAQTHPDRQYHLFLHLFDAQNHVVAQFDGPPVPAFPTEAWPPNSTWRGTYAIALPAGLPDGDYRLVAGIYRVSDGQRLSLSGDPDLLLADNRFLLSTVRMEP